MRPLPSPPPPRKGETWVRFPGDEELFWRAQGRRVADLKASEEAPREEEGGGGGG